jgi:hypothetical protein
MVGCCKSVLKSKQRDKVFFSHSAYMSSNVY